MIYLLIRASIKTIQICKTFRLVSSCLVSSCLNVWFSLENMSNFQRNASGVNSAMRADCSHY